MDRPTPEARQRLLRDGFGEAPRFSAFLASLDGRDVGYAIVYEAYSSFLARPTLYLEDLYVEESARGCGFGTVMFERLVDEALERGCARMEWMVVDWNHNAIGFYERRGAERMSEWHSYRIEAPAMRRLRDRRRVA